METKLFKVSAIGSMQLTGEYHLILRDTLNMTLQCYLQGQWYNADW